MTSEYDPVLRGKCAVERKTRVVEDARRGRRFAREIWSPQTSGTTPVILFSHFSGGDRNASSYLCEHVASHGYTVTALDHSDNQLPRPSEGANAEEKRTRLKAWIDARVPDVRFLLETVRPGSEDVGIIGHSFGGWTALAAPSEEPRIAAVVALAPAGSTNPRPGVIPATLDFAWTRDVPTLVIVGDSDVSIPPDRARDVFERVPSSKKFVVLHGVDHVHFVDDAQVAHERVRAMQFPPELEWMQREIRPFAELRPEGEAHAIVMGLAVAHFDATLKGRPEARAFLESYPAIV